MSTFPRLIAITWSALAVYLGITIASRVTADGFRDLSPLFSSRLSGGWLFWIFGITRLDVATLCSFVFVGSAFLFMDRSLRDFLLVDPIENDAILRDQHRMYVRCLGYAIMLLDTALFFVGLSNPSGWESQTGNVGLFLVTAAYFCTMSAMAYINILLWLKVEKG